MLAVIATFLITWIVMGLIGWCLSDLSFKECMSDDATIMLMFIIGWMPCLFVASDLNDYLKD